MYSPQSDTTRIETEFSYSLRLDTPFDLFAHFRYLLVHAPKPCIIRLHVHESPNYLGYFWIFSFSDRFSSDEHSVY